MTVDFADLDSLSNYAQLLRSLSSDTHKPDVLIVCPGGDSKAVGRYLRQLCAVPVRCCVFPGPLCLPRDPAGTFLLDPVNKMTVDQQVALYDWMSPSGRPQVVSIATTALEPLVANGDFLEALCHRLSVVRLVNAA